MWVFEILNDKYDIWNLEGRGYVILKLLKGILEIAPFYLTLHIIKAYGHLPRNEIKFHIVPQFLSFDPAHLRCSNANLKVSGPFK